VERPALTDRQPSLTLPAHMATLAAPTLASETIAHIGSFEIRNTMIMAWLAMLVLIAIALAARGTGYKLIPGRFQALIELVIESLYDFFQGIFQNHTMTKRFFPLVATMFLFILVANWMGILPGVGTITVMGEHNGHQIAMPLFRSMNADVNMTLTFAMVAVLAAQIVGITTLGILPHARKYFVAPWKKPFLIGTFIGILELVGEFSRILSFSFRLFGNIFAGEVLLVVISFLVPYLLPIPFLGMELFVGVIQAMVFAMLTSVFIVMATISHEDHEEHAVVA